MPIVYPTDDYEPSNYDEENQRQLAEKRRLEEEARRGGSGTATEQPIIDVRVDPNESEHQNEIDNENAGKSKPDEIPLLPDDHPTPPAQEYLTTSTTVKPTKRRPIKQDSVCKLSAEPEPDVGYEAGYRFGTVNHSHIEFNEAHSKLKKGYEISFEFKTDQPDGLLFYAADNRHTDFIAVYLQDGYVSITEISF